MDKAREVLRETFGFPSFRLSQEEVIKRLVVDSENALVLYPTGGGKSLTYQVPALCLDGLTLVISPLIALMRDQVEALRSRGVKAANLDSTLNAETTAWVKSEVLSGALKILYVAPERLNNESFIDMMSRVKISLLAVDESHCISQWGSSFRPEYLKIARFAEEQDVERVLCLTATATKGVAEDICKSFLIDPVAGVFRTPVYRPNLSFRVAIAKDMDSKINQLFPLVKERTGPAIIYVTLQRHAEEAAAKLKDHSIDALVYHAGLPSDERERVQNDFMQKPDAVVCCTIAFGMGIDKANVRLVAHLFMPKTLENYSQEVGRAGRDGLPSTCLMFLSAPDIPALEGFARGDTCAEKDLQLWVHEVAAKAPAADGTLDFNLYQQSKEYDIRSNVLNLCYAQLELDYNYLRAVTPFYSVYTLSQRTATGWNKVLSDTSDAAKAIKGSWIPKRGGGHEVDVVNAASRYGVDRAALAKKVSDWEFDGSVVSKPSQVRMRYQVLNPLPRTSASIEELVKKMYVRMVAREEEAVQKLREVIKFATDDDCLAHTLASYFGDVESVPNGMCGTCTFCSTAEAVEFMPTVVTIPDPRKIRAILDACPERDDPRLLARMAFGITSPRLTVGKWSTSHELFGSMGDVDFDALVKAFDVECKKAGYARASEAAPAPTKKRSYTQSSNSSQGGSYGRGGSSKRARSWRGKY
ncbi:ATP-dependent DNA helicase [Neolentinus lepideus HHB14362 ss-1]|uniref:ATP-dependent DNA helicase n=1 Tax=Neolentinus lepideus HHB14362 ss-1 TaxID=1314782 RepID=A0A165W3R6_9AGAM|nr:ATP-dependent DNA helicase [Neolentinus lepideus HHB14362 ss-1]